MLIKDFVFIANFLTLRFRNKNLSQVNRTAIYILLTGLFICLSSFDIKAQNKEGYDEYFINDSLPAIVADYDKASAEITADNDPLFIPDPNKAVWYAALVPGGGQIYNRKYWKLPIIYGGYLGCVYAFNFNQRYYKSYSNAYRDLVEDNPAKSYLDFVSPSFDVNNAANKQWLEKALKRKKDSYRRDRDLSVIVMLGVYLLSMVDAYVDASLYHFDISPDLSLRIDPAIIEPTTINRSRVSNTSLGLQCSINF